MMFRRSILSDRQEAAVQKTLQNLRAQRRSRFRILACIDGTEESLVTVRFAARFSVQDSCDLIVLFPTEWGRCLEAWLCPAHGHKVPNCSVLIERQLYQQTRQFGALH